MDYNPGGASPNHIGDGSLHLVCECGYADDYTPDDADSGFFSCRQCSALHPIQDTAADPHDFHPTGNISVRRVTTQQTMTPRTPHQTPHAAAAAAAPTVDDFEDPRDFAHKPDDLPAYIRLCYVHGLQVILQRQLEVLVERFRVGPLVCGIAGTIWVRWVAASEVFSKEWACQALETWAPQVRANHKKSQIQSGGGDDKKPGKAKHKLDDEKFPRRIDGCRVEFAFLRSLRMMLPVYSTLAVCFLACHVTREAILPTDIYKWAMENKIPYMAAFNEVDKLLGSSTKECPLGARQLFWPVQVIGAWQLETKAGFIAEKIGLRLPSVNFYAIALRCLKDLSLPLNGIIPQTCRIYEGVMPAELWLSSNSARILTRVCVMSILIVALRLLFNINGQGIWEEICEERRNTAGSDSGANSPPFMSPGGSNSEEEFGIRELLCTLAASYDKINVGHETTQMTSSHISNSATKLFFLALSPQKRGRIL